jgi:hypothetical protein
MNHRVLIAGAGQLGSRYLQGLSNCRLPLEIWTFDTSEASLDRARQRWAEVAQSGSAHRVDYVMRLTDLPPTFDLAVVATTADVRPALVGELARHSRVGNWVLEKILAQSTGAIETITAAIGPDAGAWVNTPMHMWTLYSRLRERHPGAMPVEASFEGFRGLVCNAIHYIDLMARWNGASIASVDTSGLQGPWYPAKREGFFEADGVLRLSFSDGSLLHLSSYRDKPGYRARMRIDNLEWEIREPDGLARAESGETLAGPVEFQSQLTGPLAESVLQQGRCALPTLAQSAAQHVPFLAALQAHWNATMPTPRNALPIT